MYEVGETFMLQNGYVRAEFDNDGILQTVTTIDDRKKEKVNLVNKSNFVVGYFLILAKDSVTRLGIF